MKINELTRQVNVVFQGQKESNKKICDNCNRLKIDHSNDQMYNCVYALYFKA